MSSFLSRRTLACSAALSVAGALCLLLACTSSPIAPLGPSTEAGAFLADTSSQERTDGSPHDAHAEGAVPTDSRPPSQFFGEAGIFFPDGSIEGGAGAVDAGEVVPLPPSDGGPFAFLDAPFLCGATACAPATHYCLHILPDGGIAPEGGGDLSDKCLPVPAACASSPSCACLQGKVPCEAGLEGEGCVEGAGVEVSCPTY